MFHKLYDKYIKGKDREGLGIGRYGLSYIEFFDKNNKADLLIFPVSLNKRAKPLVIRSYYINKEVNEVLNTEIRHRLIDLYINADFNKETRELYKMSIPQIKKLYESIYNSINAMRSSDEYISDKAINEFFDNKDNILEYIANIQKPIDKIVDYHKEVKRAESDINDVFSNIKVSNNLEKSEIDILADKYETTNRSSRALQS